MPKEITIFITTYVKNEDKSELFVLKENGHDEGDARPCRHD